MKKIRQRRKHFRINSPLTFGILCGVILLAIGGTAFGLAAGVIAPAIDAVKNKDVTPVVATLPPETETATPEESPEVVDASQPSKGEATPEPVKTTATPEPAKATATPAPSSEDQGAVKRLTGHVIAIDAAKGKGAKYKGVSSKTPEYVINLNYANAVKDILEAEGATVIMTRTDNTFVANKTRYKNVNASKAELCVTILCNSISAGSTRGAFAIVPTTKARKTVNKSLAEAVISGYAKLSDVPLRETGSGSVRVSGDWETLNGMKIPCCAIVLGHISNKEDDALLNDSTQLARGAQGIANGIISYLNKK